MTISKDKKQTTISTKNDETYVNVVEILIYSLIFAISLGINDLFLTVFKKFKHKNIIIAQIIYIFLLIGIVLTITYFMNIRLKYFKLDT